jgi:hypothetical protein
MWPTGFIAVACFFALWIAIGTFIEGFGAVLGLFILTEVLLIGGEAAGRAVMWKADMIPSWASSSSSNTTSTPAARGGSGGGGDYTYVPPANDLRSSDGV